MKNKLMAVLMATALLVLAVTGCGSEKAPDEGDVRASVSQSVEESTQKISQGNAEQSAQEASVEITETKDWSKAYDDYFERVGFPTDNMRTECTATTKNITLTITVAMADEQKMMGMDLGMASIDMYMTNGKIYACTMMDGQETWTWADAAADQDVETIMSMGETNVTKADNIVSCTYLEEVTEDGITYDVLNVVVKNSEDIQNEVQYYVNRETQQIEKCATVAEDGEMVCYFEEIESIEMPVAASSAKEVSIDEIFTSLATVLYAGAAAVKE